MKRALVIVLICVMILIAMPFVWNYLTTPSVAEPSGEVPATTNSNIFLQL